MDILELIVRWAVPAILGGAVTYFGFIHKQIKVQNERFEQQEKTMFTLVKSQLVGEWSRLTQQGYAYLHDLEAVNGLHCQYIARGGNGLVKLLMMDIESLERRTTKHEAQRRQDKSDELMDEQ